MPMNSNEPSSRAGAKVAEVSMGWGAFARLIVFAFLAGWPVAVLGLTGVRDAMTSRGAASSAPFDVVAAVLLVVIVLLPTTCLALRKGGRRRVTWDDDGVTEWEDDSVRTFIPRDRARAASEVRTWLRRVSKSKKIESKRYVLVQISDEQGRRITLAWADPLFRFGFSVLPLWMRRRPLRTSLEAAEGLLAWLPWRPNAPPIEPDKRSAQRPMAQQSARLHFAAVVLSGVALYVITANRHAAVGSGLLFVVAGLSLGLATLRPIRELRAVAREARQWKDAQQISFDAAPDGGVLVVLADGRSLHAEVDNVVHSDALVHRRKGSVRALLEVSGGSDGYRATPALARVFAVDTHAERAERRRILVACALEIAGRATHALIVLTLGVVIATRVVGF